MISPSRARELVASLAAGPGTAHDLAEEFHLSDKTVYGALSTLKRQGDIERMGGVRVGTRGPLCAIWKATEKGCNGNLRG